MLSRIDWSPLFLTFELAAVTTAILLVIGVPLALWLAGSRARWKPVAEALVSMPLVLPPSVLGFYLLLAFSPQSWLGHWLAATFDLRLVFTFEGLVLGSVLFSMPFMVHPLQSGFQSLPVSLTEAARTLGASRLKILFRVLLPNLKPSLLSGIVLAFAHTVGEFGVVLMIGGNIPDKTRVVSVQIFDHVEAMEYTQAHWLAGAMLVFSFLVLLALYASRRGKPAWS